MGWQLATQSTQLAQNKQKNETAAGVAQVAAAAVNYTMNAGHQLLGSGRWRTAPSASRRSSPTPAADSKDVAPVLLSHSSAEQQVLHNTEGPFIHRESPELLPPLLLLVGDLRVAPCQA